jgi:hypothetical protein
MKTTRIAIPVLLVAGIGYFALRPVCVPLSSEDLASFNVPIEQRTDRDLYIRVFQRREGQWCQCKTWLSRQFFF